MALAAMRALRGRAARQQPLRHMSTVSVYVNTEKVRDQETFRFFLVIKGGGGAPETQTTRGEMCRGCGGLRTRAGLGGVADGRQWRACAGGCGEAIKVLDSWGVLLSSRA